MHITVLLYHWNLSGEETDVLQKYILINDAPVCFKDTEFGKDCWVKYIKPVLKSLQKEKYKVSTLNIL